MVRNSPLIEGGTNAFTTTTKKKASGSTSVVYKAPSPITNNDTSADLRLLARNPVNPGIVNQAGTAVQYPQPKVIGTSGGYQILDNGMAGAYVGPEAPPPPPAPGTLRDTIIDDPTPPGAPAGEPVSPIAGFNAAEIEAALNALQAKYGLTREQLLADQTEIGDTYRFLTMNLEKSRGLALQGVDQDSLARGVLRSGINQENRARVANDFSQREAQAEGEKAGRLRAINSALGALDSGLASDQAGAAQGLGLEQLGSKERLADILRLAGR